MEEPRSLFEFNVDDRAGRELTELSRWTRLFGIIVWCLVAICLVVMIFTWNRLESVIFAEAGTESTVMMGIAGVVIVVVMTLAAIMMYFLVRSGNRIRNGLNNRDQQTFNNGLQDLKTFFIFMGVYGILSLLSNLISLIP